MAKARELHREIRNASLGSAYAFLIRGLDGVIHDRAMNENNTHSGSSPVLHSESVMRASAATKHNHADLPTKPQRSSPIQQGFAIWKAAFLVNVDSSFN